MRECLSEGNTYLQTAPEQLRQIERDFSSAEWYSNLELKLGEKAAQQSKNLLEEKREKVKTDIAHTQQVNGYLRTLIAHYSEVVTVTDATLKEMKSALDVAVRQRLDLAMKLDTYQGLTANQVEFAEAVQFLREVQHITDGLDNSMNAVDGVFSTEVGKYVANAPETPRIAPSVDVARVKLLTQGEKR